MKKLLVLTLICVLGLSKAWANSNNWTSPFTKIYRQQLGSLSDCQSTQPEVFRICSNALKNDGNGPYILHHGTPTETTVVLFHGLSDSPFFLESIASSIHQQGYTVIVGLLPGHGKRLADDDMEDAKLAQRWTSHVKQVMNYAHQLSDRVYIGGFSTGGVLATQYLLNNPHKAQALLLFSGALALDESVESMANIWGIKLLAKLLDWHYETEGPNPFKYPSVSKHSAMMLADVIFDVRQKLEQNANLNLPIFSAHSKADITTPIRGVKHLLAQNQGLSTQFFIEQNIDVCHADLVVNQQQIEQMNFDVSQVDPQEPCSVPIANPQHDEMLRALQLFLQALSNSKD